MRERQKTRPDPISFHALYGKIITALIRASVNIHKASFVIREVIRSRLSSKRRMKILFSKEEDSWEKVISRGFLFTQHKIAFKKLTPENIKKYDLVVPLSIDSLKHLNAFRHLIPNNPIPIPNIESLDSCDDKYKFNQALIKNGFGDYVPKTSKKPQYPYILKKRIDIAGKNCYMIFGSTEEREFSDILDHQEYYCQEAIPGANEYATHILFKDNKILCSINIKYVFRSQLPIKGKDLISYTKLCTCPYLDIFSSVLTSIGFDGLCCVNYKVVNRHPYILEINPRFGQSLSRYFFSFIKYIK